MDRDTRPIRVVAPATTANLGPGFDCLGLALDLWNQLDVLPGDPGAGPVVEINGEGAGELSTGRDNLVYRSMAFLFQEANQEIPRCSCAAGTRYPWSAAWAAAPPPSPVDWWRPTRCALTPSPPMTCWRWPRP